MEIKQAARALSALAQESRLEVFRLLVAAGPVGLPAGRIADELDITPATLSFHLKALVNAGLLVDRRQGRSVIYSPDIDGIRALLSFLMQDCCRGQPELCEPLMETQRAPKRRSKKHGTG